MVRDRGEPVTNPSRTLRWGVAAASGVAAVACAVHAFFSPLLSSADEAAHIDYAYQVWHGHLPIFEDGLTIQPGFGVVPPVQWVAQHPPLFYALEAPVIGPFLDAGRFALGGYAGRALNALLAAALVAVVVWAASQVLPGRRRIWLAAGLVTALNAWVIRVGGAVYNDLLAALTATLVLGVTVRILRRGPSWLSLGALAAAAGAALATRAALVVVVAVALAVLVVHAAATSRSVRRSLAAAGAAVGVLVLSVAPTAWFYLRNVHLTGSVLGGHPDWAAENLGRVTRPWSEVLVDPATWVNLWAVVGHDVLPRGVSTVWLLVVPALLAGAAVVVSAWLRHTRPGTAQPRTTALTTAAVAAALALSVAAVVGTQVLYAAGGGGLNPRYLLPVLFPISLTIAYGLMASRRLGTTLLAAWCTLTTAELGAWAFRSLDTSGAVYPMPGMAALAAVVLGVVLTLVAVHRLVPEARD